MDGALLVVFRIHLIDFGSSQMRQVREELSPKGD